MINITITCHKMNSYSRRGFPHHTIITCYFMCLTAGYNRSYTTDTIYKFKPGISRRDRNILYTFLKFREYIKSPLDVCSPSVKRILRLIIGELW